jgi:hypothetical protein
VETCTAPSNIACIKYWGKDSVAQNTPINSSVSVTLDQRDLRAVTTVCASKDFATDQCDATQCLQPLDARAPLETPVFTVWTYAHCCCCRCCRCCCRCCCCAGCG